MKSRIAKLVIDFLNSPEGKRQIKEGNELSKKACEKLRRPISIKDITRPFINPVV
jgi:hypothetical protein